MSLQEEGTTENDISEVPAVTTTTSSAIYDRKQQSKAIRVLTVLAYVLSVSLAAILLSIYYVFVWDGHPTLAARSDPHAQFAPDSESLQVNALQEVSRKRDTSIFLNGDESMTNEMEENDLLKGSIEEVLVRHAANSEEKKCEENEDEREKDDDTSQIFSDYSFLNSSENSTVWMVPNNSMNLDEFRIGLGVPDPTMDYEDSTYYTTPPSDENSTWFSELGDFNSDYGILSKRSIFMKKLLGHHNTMPK